MIKKHIKKRESNFLSFVQKSSFLSLIQLWEWNSHIKQKNCWINFFMFILFVIIRNCRGHTKKNCCVFFHTLEQEENIYLIPLIQIKFRKKKTMITDSSFKSSSFTNNREERKKVVPSITSDTTMNLLYMTINAMLWRW